MKWDRDFPFGTWCWCGYFKEEIGAPAAYHPIRGFEVGFTCNAAKGDEIIGFKEEGISCGELIFVGEYRRGECEEGV